MTKLTEHNAITGETITRDMTADELEQYKIDKAQSAKAETESLAKIAARQSALAKLADLGLTSEEIAAL